ncbi:MAG: NUDIX domain-containing protein [Thermoanaerobaculia bacterium]
MDSGPRLTVDSLTVDPEGRILLVRRARPPFRGRWALPGGFVELGETVEEACVRETKEETGIDVEIDRIAGVFSRPDRDPRGHTASIVFRCRAIAGELAGGDDAAEARWFAPSEWAALPFAFDHAEIVARHAFA